MVVEMTITFYLQPNPMLNQIKEAIFKKYKPEDQKGLFLSLLNGNKILLTSNGVIATDKPLGQLIDLLYNGIVAKHPETQTIIADIILDITPQNDVATLLSISPTDNGILMINKSDKKSGIMLPWTADIPDMKTALTKIKSKFGLSGDVEMYTFKTEKITIGK